MFANHKYIYFVIAYSIVTNIHAAIKLLVKLFKRATAYLEKL